MRVKIQHSINKTLLLLENILKGAMVISSVISSFLHALEFEIAILCLAYGSLLREQGGKTDYKFFALYTFLTG